MIRSSLAVLAGFTAMAIGVMVATAIAVKVMLHAPDLRSAMSLKPTPGYLAVNLIYSSLFAALGGFITASVAARLPMNHVLALAGLLFVMSMVSFLQSTASGQPRWYGFVLMLLGPVCALLGGYLQTVRQSQ